MKQSFSTESLRINFNASKRALQVARFIGLALGLIGTPSVYGQYSQAFAAETIGATEMISFSVKAGLKDPINQIDCVGSVTFQQTGNCILTSTVMGDPNLWDYSGPVPKTRKGVVLIYQLAATTTTLGSISANSTAEWVVANYGFGGSYQRQLSIQNVKPIDVPKVVSGWTRADLLAERERMKKSDEKKAVLNLLQYEQEQAAIHEYTWQIFGLNYDPRFGSNNFFIQDEDYLRYHQLQNDNDFNAALGMPPTASMIYAQSTATLLQKIEAGFIDEGITGGYDIDTDGYIQGFSF